MTANAMQLSPDSRPGNRLLAALPQEAYDRIASQLQRVDLPRAKVLHTPGENIRDLYFPLTCLISITVTMRDGGTAEAGAIGSREVVGVNAFMGGRETTQTEYIVQVPGEAIRVPAQPLLEEFDAHKQTRDVFLKYTQALIAHISQNAACNRLHTIEQRYARWLLEVRDRIRSDDVKLTHEFMSQMLGVRRAGVTEASMLFERRGLLKQRRGMIRIIDPSRLRELSCECFSVVRDEYDRLLGDSWGKGASERELELTRR